MWFLTVITGFLPVTGLGLIEVVLGKVFGFAFVGGAKTGAGAVVAAKHKEFAATNRTAHKLTTKFFKSMLLGLMTNDYGGPGSNCIHEY